MQFNKYTNGKRKVGTEIDDEGNEIPLEVPTYNPAFDQTGPDYWIPM